KQVNDVRLSLHYDQYTRLYIWLPLTIKA
ncbi:uncharacterized protein METZ01_LOCUS274820, partial [marine metagenome]